MTYPAPTKVYALSKVFQHGKIQVPKDVRAYLNIKDGDKLLWYTEGSRLFIKKIE